MFEEEKFCTNEFAYFVGVMQGDGSYGTYADRREGHTNKFRACFTLAAIDLEMVKNQLKYLIKYLEEMLQYTSVKEITYLNLALQ